MPNTSKGSCHPPTPQQGAAPRPSPAAPIGTRRSLRGEPVPAHRDGFCPGFGKAEEPPGGERLASELGFNNQELVCILDFNPVRLGPCARCNLSSSSGSKCSPSAEVLAPRLWFGPSFHGKLNNHMRERKGERARGKKNQTYQQFFQKWKEPKHILAPSALKRSYFPPDLEQPFEQRIFQFSFLLK